MDENSDSLLKKIQDLLDRELGDTTRLMHIKKTIIENKKLYRSDIQYVNGLDEKNSRLLDEFKEDPHKEKEETCWRCTNNLESNARFCSFCGADQEQKDSDFTEVLSRRRKMMYSPWKVISSLHSYQILSIIGGICALVPILIALSNLERIFEIIEFYTERDFSELFLIFTALGVISSVWSFLALIIPLFIKKPKKIGKFLFFSSFGILVSSLSIGVVGFPIILVASIFALKKRRY